MSDAGDVLDSAKTGLKGKIGPVPVWLIAAILGIVAVGGYYVYSRKSNAADASAEGTAPDTASVSSGGGTVADGSIPTDTSYVPAGYLDNSNAPGYSIPQSQAASGAASSNALWLIAASTAVADQGGGYVETFAALVKYINGDPITSAQKALVDKAIAAKGYPPEGLDGISSVSDPTTPVVAQPTPAATNPSPAPAPTPVASPTPTPAPSSGGSGTPVKVTNPVKTTTPAKPPADPGQTKGNSSVIGTKFTLEKPHKGYLTADAANAQKGAVTTVQPGTYYVINKATRSGGAMINLGRVKGVPGAWINP